MEINSSSFLPLNPGLYSSKDRWHPDQIGCQIDSHVQGSFPNINYAELAIFNVPEFDGSDNQEATSDCYIRDSLYRLYFKSIPKIADLGTLIVKSSRKKTFDLIEQVCVDLIYNGIIPVIIGGGHDISYAVYKSYSKLEKTITLSCFDSSFNIGLKDDKLKSSSFLSKIISYKPNHLFNFINVGYQTFFVKPEEINLLNKMNFETYRLGEIKNSFHEIEPLLRSTDFMSFDMSSVMSSSFASNVYSTPNGFSSEEACKIFRYAGISDKISTIGIFEYNQSLDMQNQGAQLISQMIWYFLEGYKSRKYELNPNIDNCIKYTVAFEDGNTEIEFFKSNLSGRWWMGVPFKKLESDDFDQYFVACSYADYEKANKGSVPARWIKTYNRFL